MATPILGLRTTIYRVSDLDLATEWYKDAFGIDPYFENASYVGFNIAGYELGLMADDTKSADKSENILTYWGVEDIHPAIKHFLSVGAKTHEDPVDVGQGIMVGSVKDPWGNVVGLIFNPIFELP